MWHKLHSGYGQKNKYESSMAKNKWFNWQEEILNIKQICRVNLNHWKLYVIREASMAEIKPKL